MALYKQLLTGKYHWGIWKVDETLDELLSLLPDNGAIYTDDLNTFKSESRKIEWLAVRVLLFMLTEKKIPISYHPNGKPYLPGDDHYISISHTKGYVAVIVSETNEVGIDIEKVGERVHKVAHKFVRDDEELPSEQSLQTTALLLIWSTKEVMFKCMNEEAVDFREHMHVNLNQMDGTWIIGQETRTDQQRKFLINYMIHPEFVMTWTAF